MKYLLKISLLFLLLTSLVSNLGAQILAPVKWDFKTKKLNDCEYELVFNANIDKTWHLYGQKSYGDEGPIPTSFKFTKNDSYKLVGNVTESKLIKKFEPVWNFELQFFENQAVFTQKVKLKTDKKIDIKGEVEFMVCNESQCLPPTTVEFNFNVVGTSACMSDNNSSTNTTTPACNCDSNAIYQTFALRAQQKTPNDSLTQSSTTSVTTAETTNTAAVVSEPETKESRSWWGIFIAGFLGGLAALLTPCVFPMIPMTVSFFTKSSKTRAKGISNALIYAASIIGIYVLLGLGVTKAFGPDALNALSTNVWFNLAFFVLLVVFAISFLGAFEIVLPSAFVNKIDAQSDKGGLIGIFFMAFTLALVSFSCTGPIIGTLLVEAAVNGGIQGPFLGMLGFSVALALPFGLFAAFPGWLNSLPKSGGWLNSVKVVLGFLELALALKFASNADLVVQAGIITREIFIALWVVIFGLLGIYLMGWIRLSHDSPLQHLSVTRLFFAIITFSFTVYLIPGMWGAPLKLISGFPPPDFYSESPHGISTQSSGETATMEHPKEHCPNDLPCFHDYDKALAYAKKVGKPLMIDFTGWACVNCRKMESQVWTDAEVDKRLRNDVVVVSLYVDDKTKLPESERTTKKLGDLDFKINTIGNKWSYMQANVYKTNAQPQYILIDHNEQMLTQKTSGYNPDIQNYIGWLDEGINEFKKRSGK
ncbi:MAG: cytochrome c biogenesis protein CcdA [Bacteroidia bacterium]